MIIRLLLAFITFWLLLYAIVRHGLQQFPSHEEIKGCLTTKMFQVHLCPESKDYVPLSSIPNHLKKALIVSEDSLFWQHQGFDWASLEENFKKGMRTGKFKRGGSTITQQLAKNMFLSPERTFFRKAKEAIITLQIEKSLSKEEILERYLNVVEFGPQIYGIRSAAKIYFSKSPKELNLAESSFLVMLLPNPKKYSQSFRHKKLTAFADRRVRQIIDNMLQFKMISEEQYQLGQMQVDNLFHDSRSMDEHFNSLSTPTSPQPTEDKEEEYDDDLFL